jgi:predicted transcriptional regulator
LAFALHLSPNPVKIIQMGVGPTTLSRREREIMDALFALGQADAQQVRDRLDDAAGYDSVRTLLRILEGKGHVRKERRGKRYVYTPTQDRAAALKGAWRNLVQTFFGGSHERAAATLLSATDKDLNEAKLARLLDRLEGKSDEPA